MKRTLVIYGDKEMGAAVSDGVARGREAASMKRIADESRAKMDMRPYANRRRLRRARWEIQRKYPIKHHGRLYGAFWGLVGLLCCGVYAAADFVRGERG